jgi:hypothetical protein
MRVYKLQVRNHIFSVYIEMLVLQKGSLLKIIFEYSLGNDENQQCIKKLDIIFILNQEIVL